MLRFQVVKVVLALRRRLFYLAFGPPHYRSKSRRPPEYTARQTLIRRAKADQKAPASAARATKYLGISGQPSFKPPGAISVRSELDNGRAEDIATSGSNNFRRVLPESSVNRDSLAGYVSNVDAVQCRSILCPCEPFSMVTFPTEYDVAPLYRAQQTLCGLSHGSRRRDETWGKWDRAGSVLTSEKDFLPMSRLCNGIDTLSVESMANVHPLRGPSCRQRFELNLQDLGRVQPVGETKYRHVHCWGDTVQIRIGGFRWIHDYDVP